MKKRIVCLLLVMLFIIACKTDVPESLDAFLSHKTLVVTLFKDTSRDSYAINIAGMKISSEKKEAVRELLGVEEIGTYRMVYNAECESFLLLPIN